MKKCPAFTIALSSSLILLLTACKSTGSFQVQTNEAFVSGSNPTLLGPSVPLPEVSVTGQVFPSTSNALVGDTSYSQVTNLLGVANIYDPEVPAFWNHQVTFEFDCGPNDYIGSPDGYRFEYGVEQVWMTANYAWIWTCIRPTVPEASSRFAIYGSAPASITFNSEVPLSTSAGMPQLLIYNASPSIVATLTAASVASDGSSATFPYPASLPPGAYGTQLLNKIGPNSSQPAGFNFLSVAQQQVFAGTPFGIAVAGQTDAYEDRDTCDRTDDSGSSYFTTFVVSLYSQGLVLVGGQSVTVGTNPTAVAAYVGPSTAQASGDECDEDRDVYSGQTRAIVTNSGSNSVSILDLVNDNAVLTLPVGEQPDAVVVSSNGSAAYVANYGSSTVTSINLSAGTVGTTVAVGGQPTSVALSASGTLWVGGVGFLTEINTNTMTVVTTQVIPGKSIIGLAYSDLQNQVVATTSDASGNVYSEQISPSSVAAGKAYSPDVSNKVSSLALHYDALARTNVQAFTSTMANSGSLNPNQTGAPPLVVQDGWVAITATPTGFTVTDITSGQVLISEKTPSPVAAIAVDPNLNVAYLTLPDSNVLLTVPLPGVN